MAAAAKEKLGRRVKYFFAVTGTVTDELIQEAIEALAAGGIAVIRQQVAKALETARTGLSTANPGPDGVRLWLERFAGSACAAAAEELAGLVSGRIPNPQGEAEFIDTLNDGLGALAVGLTRTLTTTSRNSCGGYTPPWTNR
ncbi:MAG: hypothetical protein M0Z41_11165 [Peptococcaceae bacterium]|jgi:hypothetical protein|nr:hypothetical protein [Peptococcaceae bacterium]